MRDICVIVEGAYPRVTGGKRACPPEDVGGVPGYADFLEAVADPRHPEHDSMLEWIGAPFDPERFDVISANDRLPCEEEDPAEE